MYLFSKESRWNVGPSQPPFPGGKWDKSKANHSPPSNDVKKNISTAPYMFNCWCLIKYRQDYNLLFSGIYLFTDLLIYLCVTLFRFYDI